MSRSGKVLKNSIILATQQIVVNLITIFVVGYTARKLGLEDYGVFSLAFTFPLLFMAIGNLGLRTLTIREISRNREDYLDYLSRILLPRLVLILIMGVLIILAAYILGYSKKIIIAISIAAISYSVELISRIILDIFQAFEEMDKIAIRDVIVRVLTGIASAIALYNGLGLFAICWIYTAGTFIGLIINIVLYMRRFEWPGIKYDYDFVVSNLKEGVPFMLTGFASMLYIKFDIIMISKLLGTSSVGIYNASANLFNRLNFVCDAIATATFPAISQLFWKDHDEANRVFSNSVRNILILSVPMAVGGVLLSDSIIELIYGPKFATSVPIFCILVTMTPMMFQNTLFNYVLGAVKEQRFVLLVITSMAIMNIILNFLLLPLIGEIGAAFATLTTQAFAFVVFGLRVRKKFSVSIEPRIGVALLISLVLMAAIIIFTKPLGFAVCFLLSSAGFLTSLTLIAGSAIDIKKILKLKV